MEIFERSTPLHPCRLLALLQFHAVPTAATEITCGFDVMQIITSLCVPLSLFLRRPGCFLTLTRLDHITIDFRYIWQFLEDFNALLFPAQAIISRIAHKQNVTQFRQARLVNLYPYHSWGFHIYQNIMSTHKFIKFSPAFDVVV
jgi:hypothetical protein